ncbi:hypothetical protein CR513_50369, partial [Mucuna pruriens]
MIGLQTSSRSSIKDRRLPLNLCHQRRIIPNDLGLGESSWPAESFSVFYKSLNFGDLKPTGMTIQLANRGVVKPLGVLKDVLVQVDELIFPTDFYVLDMEDETSGKGSTLILG